MGTDARINMDELSVYSSSNSSGANLQPATCNLPTNQPAKDVQSILIDDRDTIQSSDKVILIVDDDLNFAHVLLEMVRQNGFKGIVALEGETGLAMAGEYHPDAIVLDIQLPLMNGWTVLDRLKHNPQTRHIPVHIITVDEGEEERGLKQGTLSYLQKPVTAEVLSEALVGIKSFLARDVKNLLVVVADEQQRNTIVELIGNSDVCITAVGTGATALEAIRLERFECIILDVKLPDMTGLELIGQIEQQISSNQRQGKAFLPIIVYTDQELTEQEADQLKHKVACLILKSEEYSQDHLLSKTALFLHRIEDNLPTAMRQRFQQYQQKNPELADKKILIVDDDVRNVFALASMLEFYNLQVLYAENGKQGIALLQKTPDIDIVLMDVMMPEMDGYETMRTIRQLPQFKALPMIALTAKAMAGDREKCLEAGASDYITKPVDIQQLLSLLRVWDGES